MAYGKLVAILAVRARDVASAEDALSGALAEALVAWPRDGVPQNPDAWLLTAARNNLADAQRKSRRERALPEASMEREHRLSRLLSSLDEQDSADERLTLLFVCAHPAIDVSVRTPLMLQAVMGLSAEQIAAAFVVSPATMSQRLVRAKRRIVETGVRFAQPDTEELPHRIEHVLEAIYGAYGTAYNDDVGADTSSTLAGEALDLIAIVTTQLSDCAEAWGLRSLMLLCHARRNARRDTHGTYVPLREQQLSRWDRSLIDAGNQSLLQAAQLRQPGRFQTHAAIQAAHMDAVLCGVDNSTPIASLYDALMVQAPTIGTLIARAAAWADAGHAEQALRMLDNIDADDVRTHQPYWAVRADVLRRVHRPAEARVAYDRAIGLTADHATREWLRQRSEL
jgi:RNA polymerase sigma-70 factor (ECF subfamily)